MYRLLMPVPSLEIFHRALAYEVDDFTSEIMNAPPEKILIPFAVVYPMGCAVWLSVMMYFFTDMPIVSHEIVYSLGVTISLLAATISSLRKSNGNH